MCVVYSTSVYLAFQMFSGAFSIVYVFARILWFAHLQGMKLKENDKKVSVTVIYAQLFELHLSMNRLTSRFGCTSRRIGNGLLNALKLTRALCIDR